MAWETPADDGGSPITNFKIRHTSGSSNDFHDIATTNASTRVYTLKGLTNGETYKFQVLAKNKEGWSEPSEAAIETITITTRGGEILPPHAPLDIKGVPNQCNSVYLTWKKPDYDGGSPISSYLILYEPPEGRSVQIENEITGTKFTHDTTSVPNGSIKYAIKAKNSKFTSPWSRNIEVRSACRPEPPTNLK